MTIPVKPDLSSVLFAEPGPDVDVVAVLLGGLHRQRLRLAVVDPRQALGPAVDRADEDDVSCAGSRCSEPSAYV